MSFEKFLKKSALTAGANKAETANQNSKIEPEKNFGIRSFGKNKEIRSFQCGEAEKKKKAIEERLNSRKSPKSKSADIGESRGGFSCERHSFDGERTVPLTKKPYEGNGTFGTKEHRGPHHKSQPQRSENSKKK